MIRADLGGANGLTNKAIIEELSSTHVNPESKISFATTNSGLVRGLLRMHFNSNRNGRSDKKARRRSPRVQRNAKRKQVPCPEYLLPKFR